MLWIKALHIVFVASWFAGLFYLPRLFLNLVQVNADSHAERERLLLMARKLYRFSGLLIAPALVLGVLLWLYYGIGRPGARSARCGNATQRKAPGLMPRLEMPSRCHHGRAPAQGGKAGNNSLAAIIQSLV